jgi:polygalacturonase
MALTKATNRMTTGAVTHAKDFGAVGDGVTDDTLALQAALDSAGTGVASAGGVLMLDNGTYLTSAALIPQRPLMLLWLLEK